MLFSGSLEISVSLLIFIYFEEIKDYNLGIEPSICSANGKE
jgi:hypothetical protein